jgi:hypothetical protein
MDSTVRFEVLIVEQYTFEVKCIFAIFGENAAETKVRKSGFTRLSWNLDQKRRLAAAR